MQTILAAFFAGLLVGYLFGFFILKRMRINLDRRYKKYYEARRKLMEKKSVS